MTPEQIAQFQEMYTWYQERQTQQLTLPVDDASKAALGAAIGVGLGSSALTQNITIGAGGGTAAVPKAYGGSVLLLIENVEYEIGYIRTI